MLLALLMLLFYLDRDAVRMAACLGGIGFGTFIDEVGKFLTKDNDYFFQPAVAVIYTLFVALVLGSHALLRRLPSSEEYLMNALQELRNSPGMTWTPASAAGVAALGTERPAEPARAAAPRPAAPGAARAGGPARPVFRCGTPSAPATTGWWRGHASNRCSWPSS